MTRRSVQAFDRPQATAKLNWKGPRLTALLLACTFAAVQHDAVEGRSLKANRPAPYRHLLVQSVDLPAGGGGWTLGRASYNNPSDRFKQAFIDPDR